jgi:3-hydroxybutyryl-CoA dehydrogenase
VADRRARLGAGAPAPLLHNDAAWRMLLQCSTNIGLTLPEQGEAEQRMAVNKKPDLRTVGVIGAGQMGAGIAHVCALAGYDVLLYDAALAKIDEALVAIEANMGRQVHRETISQADMDGARARIKKAGALNEFGPADLVIESIVEQEEAKRKIFSDLKAVLKPETILASNTSSISITRLAASTDRPDKFIGVHFMNPAPLMKLVELIRGLATSQETYEVTLAFVESLGKSIANAEDFPAFIVNRVLIPMINEAVYTLYEGVGSVEAIDKAMRLGANHPMGPLELADFIGLDTCLAIMQVLNEGLADPKYRPCPLLVKYVEAGWLGRKTQRGFYDYRGDTPMPTR